MIDVYVRVIFAVLAGFAITGLSLVIARVLAHRIDAKKQQSDNESESTVDDPETPDHMA